MRKTYGSMKLTVDYCNHTLNLPIDTVMKLTVFDLDKQEGEYSYFGESNPPNCKFKYNKTIIDLYIEKKDNSFSKESAYLVLTFHSVFISRL